MSKINKKIFFSVSLILISTSMMSGCSSAPKASEVTAAYVPANQYQSYTCEQLNSEAESVRRAIPSMEAAVQKHRESQTAVEVVTWVLFWPAAFALDKGTEYSAPLAQAKGQLQAIQQTMMSKKC